MFIPVIVGITKVVYTLAQVCPLCEEDFGFCWRPSERYLATLQEPPTKYISHMVAGVGIEPTCVGL